MRAHDSNVPPTGPPPFRPRCRIELQVAVYAALSHQYEDLRGGRQICIEKEAHEIKYRSNQSSLLRSAGERN
jgi:hypothetical protein